MRRSWVLLGVFLTALTMPACDSGGSDSLLDRLAPLQSGAAVVVDVAKVRSALGLPSDYGPDLQASPTSAQRLFASVVGAAYPLLNSPYQSAARTAIDLRKVTAAASNGGFGNQVVTVLATSQPFADVSKALEAGGYTHDGDAWKAPSGSRAREVTAVASAKGVIVVGGNADAVRAAAQGKNGGIKGAARQAIETLKAPAASAIAPTGSCIKALAVADDLKDRHGRLLVVADGASADRVAKDLPVRAFHVESPKVDGDRVTATVSVDENAGSLLQLIGGEVGPGQLYRCG